MKTLGKIEAAVAEGIAGFELEYGSMTQASQAYLIGELLIGPLNDVLTVAEQQLVVSLKAEKGRGLL